jgi:hypothetical protein
MNKVIQLIFDPEKESREAFEARKAEAIAETVIVNLIVNPKEKRLGRQTSA